MQRASSHAATDHSEAPDLMPMIDVVFLLLIFFVCTMSFRVIQGRLDTELPAGVGPNAGDVVVLLEAIDLWVFSDPLAPDGTGVRVGSTGPYTVESLPAILSRTGSNAPETQLVIHAEQDVSHGQVVSVVDACLASDLTSIRFAAGRGN